MKRFKKLMAVLLVFLLSFANITVFAEGIDEGKKVSVQILFTSDTHGSFETYAYSTNKETTGGLTRLATLMKQEKENFDGLTYILDIGDTIQGNGTSMFIGNDNFKPYPNIDAFNVIGYDAAVPGNHEFNFGMDNFYKAYEGFEGKKILANIYQKDGSVLEDFAPYDIFESEGLRVAVIGTVTPNIDRWDTGNLAAHKITTKSAATVTKETIDYLKAKDLADVFVSAAHMDLESEYGREGSGAMDIANACPELALIMGGHGHKITGTKNEPKIVNGIKFAENKNAAATFGKAVITAVYKKGEWVVDDKAGEGVQTDIISVTNDTPKDPDVVAQVAAAHKACINYVTKTVVGRLVGGPLVPEPEIKGTYEGYLGDNALSDLVLDVMMEYTGAEIAGTAPLDSNANAQAGILVIGDVASIYKFDNNTLYKLKMTGGQVVKWMEWAYKYYGSTIDGEVDHSKPAVNLETDLTIPEGTMPGYNQDQFAGIKYTVDLTKPVGERINVLSMADGSPFEMDKSYIVTANNYRSTTQLLTTSPDGVFQEGEEIATLLEDDVQNKDGKISMLDLIIEYISERPDQTITNDCDNNWEFINLNWDKDLRAKAVYAINNDLIQTDFKTPVTKAQISALSEEVFANMDETAADEPVEEPIEPVEEVTEEAEPVEEVAEVIEEVAETAEEVAEELTEEVAEEAEEEKTDGVSYYIVVPGDYLSKIANNLYGDAAKWITIYEYNKDTIKDPHWIYPGQELRIP